MGNLKVVRPQASSVINTKNVNLTGTSAVGHYEWGTRNHELSGIRNAPRSANVRIFWALSSDKRDNPLDDLLCRCRAVFCDIGVNLFKILKRLG